MNRRKVQCQDSSLSARDPTNMIQPDLLYLLCMQRIVIVVIRSSGTNARRYVTALVSFDAMFHARARFFYIRMRVVYLITSGRTCLKRISFHKQRSACLAFNCNVFFSGLSSYPAITAVSHAHAFVRCVVFTFV